MVAAVLSSCTSFSSLDKQTTEQVRIAATPKAEPRRTMTNFTASLRCMDDLFERYYVPPVSLAVQQVEEVADNRSGIKDMFITAISSMAARSGAIGVSLYGQDMPDLSVHNQLIHQSPVINPIDYVVRIGSPMVDDGTIIMQQSLGLQYNGGDFTVGDTEASNEGASDVRIETLGASRSADRLLSMVSLDMNLASAVDARIVHGVFSSNSIAVSRAGKATDVSASFEKFGALFDMSFDRAEGMHHTLRTLVELGAIELIGKLTQVPYWECLAVAATQPDVQRLMFDWYAKASEPELIKVVQRALRQQQLYQGEVDGQRTEAFDRAVINYKRQRGLVANVLLDYGLYATLLGAQPVHQLPEYEPQAANSQRLSKLPVALPSFGFGLQPRKSQPVYLAGERLAVDVVLSQRAYVACYHKNSLGNTGLIYPQSDQGSDALSKERRFEITSGIGELLTQGPGAHQLMCVVSQDDLHQSVLQLPAETLSAALSASNLIQVYALYKSIAQNNPSMTLPLVAFYDFTVKPLRLEYQPAAR